MTALTSLTLTQARDGLAKKQFSSQELTNAHLARIQEYQHLNAYITVTSEHALTQAKASDARLAQGQGGALEGLPLGIKDLFCTKGVLTTAASHILDGFVPQYESTVTQKLFDAGAVMLGKLNLDEFAMGSDNGTSYYGIVKNPLDTERVAGGSSGGSAAAVAADLCLAATGTDTGGSIRQPATFTGIVGIKPTYGRASRWGIVAFASSLDQAGVMTKTVDDAALMLREICGHDPKDSTSAPLPVPDFTKAIGQSVKGLRIGIPREYRLDTLPPAIVTAWDDAIAQLKSDGATIVDVSLPHTRYALACYYIIAPAEASSNLARYDGVRYGLRVDGTTLIEMYENTRAAGFGDEVQRRILIGTYVLSAGYYDAYYLKAQQVRALIAQDFTKAFEQVDALLTPTTPSAAFKIGEKQDDPVAMYMNDVLTVPISLAGLPAMSVPYGSDNGLPLGMQIIGKPFDEDMVFRIGHALYPTRRPA